MKAVTVYFNKKSRFSSQQNMACLPNTRRRQCEVADEISSTM